MEQTPDTLVVHDKLEPPIEKEAFTAVSSRGPLLGEKTLITTFVFQVVFETLTRVAVIDLIEMIRKALVGFSGSGAGLGGTGLVIGGT